MGQAEINHFMQLRNRLVIATKNFGRQEKLSPVLIQTMFKDLKEQLKLAHRSLTLRTEQRKELYHSAWVQYKQAREFKNPSPIECKKGEGREDGINHPCEL